MKIKLMQFAAILAVTGSTHQNLFAQELPQRGAPRHALGEVLIQFNANVTDGQIAAAFRQIGLKLKEHVQTPPMKKQGKIGLTLATTAMPLPVALEILNNLPGVDFAEVHGIGEPDFVSDDPSYVDGSLWGVFSDDQPFPGAGPAGTTNPYGSQAEKLWSAGYVGSSSVYVGIVDTGVQPDHPDLADNIWTNPGEVPGDGLDNDANGYIDDVHGWNSAANNGITYEFSNDDSHGTHVAGTIGAAGGNGLGVAGMNWDVQLISAKVSGANPSFLMLDVIEGIDYMIALKTQKGLNIVALNNSYSFGGLSLALQDALTRAAQAGILIVCSASNATNNNDILPRSPASLDTTADAGYDAVICVAAIDAAGSKATFSNYGLSTVDLGAPGVNILSTVPGGYNPGSGTSMATPHVTGAIALYASIFPGATATQIKTRLLTAGVVSTPSLNGLTLTGGRLDAHALVTGPASTMTTPTAPAGLTGTAAKGNVKTANLAWTDTATTEKGFAIERKTSTSATWQTIATLGPNTRTFSNTSLAARTTYNYRVRAFNAAGSSSYSNPATVTMK